MYELKYAFIRVIPILFCIINNMYGFGEWLFPLERRLLSRPDDSPCILSNCLIYYK